MLVESFIFLVFFESCAQGAWVASQTKYECDDENIATARAVSCVPSNELGGPEYAIGDTWIDENYKYQCVQNYPLQLQVRKTACFTPTGEELAIGSRAPADEKADYVCSATTNAGVFLLYRGLCTDGSGTVRREGEPFESGKTVLECSKDADNAYTIKASACLSPDTPKVPINGFVKNLANQYFKCVLQQDSTIVAVLTTATQKEYLDWYNAKYGATELNVDPDIGTTDATEPPEPETSTSAEESLETETSPQPQTTETPPDIGTTDATEPPEPETSTSAEESLETETSSQPQTTDTPPQTTTTIKSTLAPRCQDKSPLCPALCQAACFKGPRGGMVNWLTLSLRGTLNSVGNVVNDLSSTLLGKRKREADVRKLGENIAAYAFTKPKPPTTAPPKPTTQKPTTQKPPTTPAIPLQSYCSMWVTMTVPRVLQLCPNSCRVGFC